MSSSAPPIRLGLVGCGRLAELGYVPALAGMEDVVLAAVADPDPGRREAVAALAAGDGVPVSAHAGAGELVSAGGLDAVVIASPASEHVWQAELASRAGVATLVEKPPAPSASGAARLAELDPAPWIGFNRRFAHAGHLAGEVPAEGRLELELELRYRRRSWRPVSVDDDALIDLAPHLVDLALLLTGAETARVRTARLSAARAELELDTERGTATIRCATDRAHRETVVVRDAAGATVARSVVGGPMAAVTSRLPGREHPLTASLRAQLGAFAGAARGEPLEHLATAADGVRVMELIDEARRLGGAEVAA